VTISPAAATFLAGAAAMAATLLPVLFIVALHRAADRYGRERQVAEELARHVNRASDRLAAQHALADLKRMGAP
jgi:hypothetical protein